MTTKKLGKQTVAFASPPSIAGHANVVGKKEGEGPLRASFDLINQDDTFGESSWEKAESAMQKLALQNALDKAKQAASTLDFIFAGDLLNRQYRTPLEYGGQRTPTAQWTVTGAGAVVLAREGDGPYITHATVGKIVDKGIKDANNMGAAMAPAAYDTLSTHFSDTGRKPSYYDLIVTGDLGTLGKGIVLDFFHKDGVDLQNLDDCGVLIYDAQGQDLHHAGRKYPRHLPRSCHKHTEGRVTHGPVSGISPRLSLRWSSVPHRANPD